MRQAAYRIMALVCITSGTLVIMLAGIAPGLAQDGGQDGQVTVTLDSMAMEIGQNRVVAGVIDCPAAGGCSGFAIAIRFDPALVRVDEVAIGPYLGAETFLAEKAIDNDAGSVRLAAVAMGAQPEYGDPVLLDLTITALAPGVATLSVTALDIADVMGNPLAAEGIAGAVVIAEAPMDEPTEEPAEPPEPTTGPSALMTGDAITSWFMVAPGYDGFQDAVEFFTDRMIEDTGLLIETVYMSDPVASNEAMTYFVVEALCENPDTAIGVLSASFVALAMDECGVQVGPTGVRFDWPVYWSAFFVRRDADIDTLSDLNGRTWGYADPSSATGYLVPLTVLRAANVDPGEEVYAGGHTQAILALYNGEVDFVTSYFSPPEVADSPWTSGDPPEPYDLSTDESYIGEDGELYVGDVRIMDVRRAVRETAPDVVDVVRILHLSAPVPNDTIVFGANFPADARAVIEDVLFSLADSSDWERTVLGSDAGYSWQGLAQLDASWFDLARQMFEFGVLERRDLLGD